MHKTESAELDLATAVVPKLLLMAQEWSHPSLLHWKDPPLLLGSKRVAFPLLWE